MKTELKPKSLGQVFLLTIAFWLFQKSENLEDSADELLYVDDEDPAFGHIRCPICHWRPNASSLWDCVDCDHPEYFYNSCGMTWNTFATRGLCPGCGHQWRWTACLHCEDWSLHEDWYANGDGNGRPG